MTKIVMLSAFRGAADYDKMRASYEDLACKIKDLMFEIQTPERAKRIMCKEDSPMLKLLRTVSDDALMRALNYEEECLYLNDVRAGVITYERMKMSAEWVSSFQHLDPKNLTIYNMPPLRTAYSLITKEWYDRILREEHSSAAQTALQLSAVMYDKVDGFRRSLLMPRVA